MKALILVGGYGTRMRPLTINHPKSAFPFINKPMVEHQIQALSEIGVVQVVIAINYQANIIKASLQPLQQKYKIKITYSQETQAMGTAGPIKLAQKILKDNNTSGLFFVFNSDIICDFPLKDLLQFHKSHGKQASIVLAKVQDPSRFGVVVSQADGKVTSFVQKPTKFISNHINAGIYLLNVSVIQKIPERFCMIQKQTFPLIAQEGELYSFPLKNQFWFDIGKPGDYLIGQGEYLKYFKIKPEKVKNLQNINIQGNVCIDQTSIIENSCKIGPNVVIGPNCKIQAGCRLKNCTIIGNSKIQSGSFIQNSIISWRCKIGSWSRIQGLSCLAQQVEIKPQLRISECMVLSHKSISQSVSKQILM